MKAARAAGGRFAKPAPLAIRRAALAAYAPPAPAPAPRLDLRV